MSRLTTFIKRECDSRDMTPNSVRMIYIIEGKCKGATALLSWLEKYKHSYFQGLNLRKVNRLVSLYKPWEMLNEQARPGN